MAISATDAVVTAAWIKRGGARGKTESRFARSLVLSFPSHLWRDIFGRRPDRFSPSPSARSLAALSVHDIEIGERERTAEAN